jgi:hypothetical protein
MSKRDEHENPDTTEPVKSHTTADGRVIYDVLSLIRSPEAQRHFRKLDRLAELGLIPKPDPAKP